MRHLKPSSSASKLTVLILITALSCGLSLSLISADAKDKKEAGADRGRKTKVSSELRSKKRKGKDDSDSVNVILQLQGKASGRLNALLNRNGVHVNGQFKNLNMLAVELPADVLDELASFDEVSYISADSDVVSLGGQLSTTTGADAVRQQTTSTGISWTAKASESLFLIRVFTLLTKLSRVA